MTLGTLWRFCTEEAEQSRFIAKMDPEKMTALFNACKNQYNIHFDPKPEQMEICAHLHNGFNTLGFLPTGFGKTLCFVVNSMLSQVSGITLIISPLLSLMDNQIDALKHWGFSASKIAHDTSSDQCDSKIFCCLRFISYNLYY